MRNFKEVVEEVKRFREIYVVYDIGANIGAWTKEWKSTINPNAQYIMFEANPKLREVKGSNYRYFNQVLSDKDNKKVKFYTSDTNFNHYCTGFSYFKELTPAFSEGNYIELKTKTLDTFVEENKLPPPNIIKLDTQGSEVDILKGASKSLKTVSAIVTEVPIMPYNEGAPNFGDYVNILYENGFIATGVEDLKIKLGVFFQMDVVFMRKELLQKIHNYKVRYTGF